MVEIALSLAVVAFALVAILGVLPTGMTVQKENREDTLINQEGRYWIEAIRTGARGLHDLTNHVESIEVLPTKPGAPLQLTDLVAQPITPADLISLLSVPKFTLYKDNVTILTNRIVARVKDHGSGGGSRLLNERRELSLSFKLKSPIPRRFPRRSRRISSLSRSACIRCGWFSAGQ